MSRLLKKDQVRKDIVYRILSGQYLVEGRVPPERELCETMRVSRITVRAAVDDLVREGVLRRDGRRGTLIEKIPRDKSPAAKRVALKQMLFIYFSSVKGHLVSRTGTSSRIYHGVERFANEHDYVLRVQSGENFMRQSSAECKEIDGIIAGGARLEQHLPVFIESGIPTVAVDSIPHRLHVDAVSGDYYEAGMLAAEKCISKRLRNPLFIQLRFGDENFTQPNLLMRQRGFFDALEKEDGIEGHCHIVCYDDLAEAGSGVRELFPILLDKKIDGIAYCADIPYLTLMKYPEIAMLPAVIIGGRGEHYSKQPDNAPDVIRFDMEHVGYLAAQRLHERINNPHLGITRNLIPAGTAFVTDAQADSSDPLYNFRATHVEGRPPCRPEK